MNAYQRFNGALADRVTAMVSTMTCAYVFAALALVSLPTAIKQTSTLISWIAQTFLQLVLLSVIMVGQDRHAKALESHDQKLDALHEKHDRLARHLVK